MDLSVILCTFDRAASLSQTLDSFCQLELPPSLTWELIIVDNNSTDDTPAVCQAFQAKLPLRYVFEAGQGLSKARNRGVREAVGSLLVFTDDDVTLDPAWLRSLWEAANAHSNVSYLGGAILPLWGGEPRSWLTKHSATLLKGVTGHFEVPPAQRAAQRTFFGGNMALRKEIFDRGWRFREDIGVTPEQHVLGEETEMMKALEAAGFEGLYVPTAIVNHRVPPERMTESFVRHWFQGQGITKVRLGQVQRTPLVGGVPLHVWIKLAWYTLVYSLSRWTLPSSVWLRAETKLATCLGIITESRHPQPK